MALTPAITAFADDSGGTANVGNSDPIVSALVFEDTGSNDKDAAQISVFVEYWIDFTVADANTLEDIDYLEIVIWEDATADVGDGDLALDHYTFRYTESTDTWSEVGPGAADEHLVSGSCVEPADQTVGSGAYTLAFKLAKVAMHTTTPTWDISIEAVDDSAASDTEATLTFGVIFYSEVSVDASHSWTGLSPGDADQPVDGNGNINLTVTANAPFDVQAKGDGALTDSPNTIPLVKVEVHEDTLGSAVGLTTGYVTVLGLTGEAAGADISKTFMMWISIPAAQLTGAYTYTLSVAVPET